jgi:hypothetical protein
MLLDERGVLKEIPRLILIRYVRLSPARIIARGAFIKRALLRIVLGVEK